MLLTIGEIAKVLDMSADNIRYYVKEGLIKPKKNPENNYSEFSSEDVLLISDILFYRDLGLSISNIKKIFSGIPVEDIEGVIDETMDNLQKEMRELSRVHSQLQSWKGAYLEELDSIGKYSVSMMPAALAVPEDYTDEENIAKYLSKMNISKDEWMNVSVTFYLDGNLPEEEMKPKFLVQLLKTEKTMKENAGRILEDYDSVPSIKTCVHLTDDVKEMTRGIREYAAKEGLEITGEFYGWEQTNYYVNSTRRGIYTVYAPLK